LRSGPLATRAIIATSLVAFTFRGRTTTILGTARRRRAMRLGAIAAIAIA
jgi:hypothetical protein